MANWNEAINISKLHKLYTSGAITIQQLGKSIVAMLKNTEAFAISDPEIIEVTCAFGALDELAVPVDYRAALEMLYEFGDKGHKLWIEADSLDPNDTVEIAPKVRNPLDDIKPNYGPLFKGPYLVGRGNESGTEWMKYPLAPVEPKEKEEEWDATKTYRIGKIVTKSNARYQCLISCSNVDPVQNSFNKADDAWKWLGSIDKNPSDPALVFKDRLTCALPLIGRVYPASRKFRYMSETEFNKKLQDANINPATMPRDLYSYMKDCEDHYQDWLISRWHKQNLTFKEPLSA